MSARHLFLVSAGVTLAHAISGCSGSGDPAPGEAADSGAASSTPTPSAWTWTDDRSTPPLTAAQAQEGAQAGVDALAAIDAADLYGAYEVALSNGSPDCPGTYPAVGLTTGWANDCVTGTGWGFSGRSQLAWLRDVFVDDQRLEQFGEFITNARLTDPDGAALDVEGYGELREWQDGGAWHRETWLFGTFSHAGGWLEPGWLDAGASLSFTALRTRDGSLRAATLDGGLSRHGALPEGVVGLTLRELTVTEAAGSCTVAGGLVLLGASGDRVVVALSGEGATCAACGTPEGDAAALGELCVDLDALLPEGAP